MKQGIILFILTLCFSFNTEAQHKPVKAVKIKPSTAKGLSKTKTDVYTIKSGVLEAKKGYKMYFDQSANEFMILNSEVDPTGFRKKKGGSSDSEPIPGGGGSTFHCIADRCGDCVVASSSEGTEMTCSDCRDCFGGVSIPKGEVMQYQTPGGEWNQMPY